MFREVTSEILGWINSTIAISVLCSCGLALRKANAFRIATERTQTANGLGASRALLYVQPEYTFPRRAGTKFPNAGARFEAEE
jgi:hypothetical protein